MNISYRYLALGSLLLARLATAQASTALPADAEVRRILSDRLGARQASAGIVVGIIEPSGRRVVTCGSLDKDDKRPLNGDTVFEIGSATKVFTSLLLADAAQRGEVALTDPVSKYLPPEVKVPERGGKKITLQDLATHTSGLPRVPTNLLPKDPANPYADYTVQQLYDFLSTYQLPRDIGSQYEYSNLGVGLLGHALSRRAGMTYEALLRARITEPLRMPGTVITLSDTLKRRLAVGHDAEAKAVANWDLPTLAGAGAIRSTANDLLSLLSVALGETKSSLAPAMASMLAVRRPTGTPGLEIALGWHVFATAGGHEIVWHNGGTGGYRSFIAYDAKSKTGVVVLTNMFTNAGVDDIGRRLLDPSAPLAKPAKEEVKVDPKQLEKLVGRYELMPGFVLTVTREAEHLFAQATGQPRFEIYASGDHDFFLKAVDAQITFQTDDQGRATGLVLHQNGADRPGKRIEGAAPAAKEHKEVKVDPAIFDRYTGRYSLTPQFVITITREGDHLFLQATAQPKFELFAEGARDFFLKVVDAQITFQDDQGRANGLVLHQNGADQPAKRMEDLAPGHR